MTQPVQVSNIDGSLVLPLGDLLTKCFAHAGLPAEEAFSNNYLGYGLSAILLSVVMLEASIGRARYDGRLPERAKGSAVWSSLVAQEGLEDLEDGLRDVFVLRDAIVHAHLWTLNHAERSPDWSRVLAPELQPGYGDTKLSKMLTGSTEPRTGHMGLHLVSTQLDRRDVLKVVHLVLEVERRMHNQELLSYDLGKHRSRFRGEELPLAEILRRISSELDAA